jgi:hypothetical protein
MKTRLLKRLRKQAKKRVFLALLSDGEFVVKSDIGWYSQRLATYCFASEFGNAVFTMQLHEAEKTLSDARRLYMRIKLMELKRKKYQKIIKKL